MYCEDCGTKLSGGTCPNCQEELYIFENQIEDMIQPISDDFSNKIKDQKKQKDERRKNERYKIEEK